MAQRTIVQLTDDLDGKPISEGKGETIRFRCDPVRGHRRCGRR